jgi:uncharacterized protein (TIGR02246 family)
MKRFATLLAASAITLMAIACNQPADTHDADVQAIKDLEVQWNKDYAAMDADKILAHYTDDASLMATGMGLFSGKDAIHNAIKGMVSDPHLSLKFQSSKVDVAKSGDLAYSQGSYTMTMTDPQTKQIVNDHGSYVTAYRKQADGSWKAVSDIATSDVPPPAPPPAPTKKHS